MAAGEKLMVGYGLTAQAVHTRLRVYMIERMSDYAEHRAEPESGSCKSPEVR